VHRTTYVKINDRGPFGGGRVLDVSKAAAAELDMLGEGVVPVRAELVRLRPDMEVNQAPVPMRHPGVVAHPYYWVSVNSPGPLVLRVIYGSEMAPLMGSGGTDWYLWLLGLRMRLATTDEWIS